jgi:hypothetical protein
MVLHRPIETTAETVQVKLVAGRISGNATDVCHEHERGKR